MLMLARRCSVLSLTCLASCGTFSIDHMFAGEERPWDHPWHEAPSRAAAFIVAAPLIVLSIPLILIDATQDWGWVGSPGADGISGYFVKVPAMTVGYVVGLPFLVLGLPWESGAPATRPAPAQSQPSASRPSDAESRPAQFRH